MHDKNRIRKLFKRRDLLQSSWRAEPPSSGLYYEPTHGRPSMPVNKDSRGSIFFESFIKLLIPLALSIMFQQLSMSTGEVLVSHSFQ